MVKLKEPTYTDTTPVDPKKDYSTAELDHMILHHENAKAVRAALQARAQDAGDTANEAKSMANDVNKQIGLANDHIDTTLAAITDKAGDSAAPEVIAARIDEKGAQHDTIGERIDSINDPIFIPNREADIGGDTTSVNLKQFTNKIDETKLNIAVITDSHYQDIYPKANDYPYGNLSLTHLANFLEIANHVDLAVALGDNTGGNYKEKANSYADQSLYADRLLYTPVKGDVAIVPGNHDDGSPAVYSSKQSDASFGILEVEDFKRIYRTSELSFDEQRDDGSLYFYKDYPDKKMRVIVLFAEDVPESEVDSTGVIKYPRWLWHGFRQAQLDWLANTALQNVPVDYHTVILNHAPIEGSGWTDTDANAKHVNEDIMSGVVNAFINGSYFTQSSNSEWANTGWEATVTADFSKQGKRTFVGWFCGHKHKQQRFDLTGFKMQMLINDVCLNANDIDTDNEGAVTVISINTETKTVNLLGWGRAADDNFNYGGEG